MEAGPRILAGLPDHIAEGALKVLTDLGVDVLTSEKVVSVDERGLKTASGREVRGDFVVWAAGIRCAEVLRDLGQGDLRVAGDSSGDGRSAPETRPSLHKFVPYSDHRATRHAER